MDQEEVINLHLSRGKIYVWNSRDVRLLRETHHIVGSLTGSLPRAPRQNNQLGLPLELMPEEAFALLSYGVAKLMMLNLPHHVQEDVVAFQRARQESFEKQKAMYLEEVREKEKLYRDSKHLQHSKRKIKLEKMKKHQKEKLRKLQEHEATANKPNQGEETADEVYLGKNQDNTLNKSHGSGDENVAHREWFPSIEKTNVINTCENWMNDPQRTVPEKGVEDLKSLDGINSNKALEKEVEGHLCQGGMSLTPEQSTSRTFLHDNDALKDSNRKGTEQKSISDNKPNHSTLPATSGKSVISKLNLKWKEGAIRDSSPAGSSLNSGCSFLGLTEEGPHARPYFSTSTSSTSASNVVLTDLNLLESRHNRLTDDWSQNKSLVNYNTKEHAIDSAQGDQEGIVKATDSEQIAAVAPLNSNAETIQVDVDSLNQMTNQVPEESTQLQSKWDSNKVGSSVSDSGCLVQLFTETVNPDVTEVKDWTFPSTDQEKIRAAVYLHFWEQGYYLTSGMKFGGDFLVYKGDPLLHHSTFIAVCLPYENAITSQTIVSYGRLGPIVKKTVVLCSIDGDDDEGKVRCISLQWSGI